MPVLVNCDDNGANLIEQNDEVISKTLGEPIANIINQKSTANLDTLINSVEFENLLELVDMVSTAEPPKETAIVAPPSNSSSTTSCLAIDDEEMQGVLLQMKYFFLTWNITK